MDFVYPGYLWLLAGVPPLMLLWGVGVWHHGRMRARFGDLANTEQLGSYTNLGAGLSFNVTSAISLDVVGDNLGNELAFTEGNPRGNSNLNAGGQAYVLARPIWGRNVKVSTTWRF